MAYPVIDIIGQTSWQKRAKPSKSPAKQWRERERSGEECEDRGGSNPSLFGNFHPFGHPFLFHPIPTSTAECRRPKLLQAAQKSARPVWNKADDDDGRLEEEEAGDRVTEQMKKR